MYLGGATRSHLGPRKTGNSQLDDVLQTREPVDDVRTNIARLEARAKEMLAPNDYRVVRTAHSVHEVSRSIRSEAAQSAHGHRNQASTEIFMAGLGFSVQEQQRLLHQISSNQTVSHPANAPSTSAAAAGEETTPNDLESFLQRCRNEAMQHAINDVHHSMSTREKEAVDKILQETWTRRKAAQAMVAHKPLQSSTATPVAKGAGATFDNVVGGSSSTRDTVALSSSIRVNSTRQVEEFSDIVLNSPTSEWLERMVASVEDNPDCSSSSRRLWSAAWELLNPVLQNKGKTNVVSSYLASSRQALERSFFAQVLSATIEGDASQLKSIHAKKVAQIITRYCTADGADASPWVLAYFAMRCGRYDAAHIFAVEGGLPSCVCEGIDTLANLPPHERNDLGSIPNIDKALGHQDTDTDGYRCAVLQILASGTPAAANVFSTKRASLEVSNSVEDTVWFRLALVRNPHIDDPSQTKLQNLCELQRELLGDQQYLLDLLGGDITGVIHLLYHALLPSASLRIMFDDDSTFVDAVHLGLVFDACGVLTATSAEAPLDMNRVLHRYCNSLLVMNRRGEGRHPAASIFAYFQKTNRLSAFAALCSDEATCAKLFGRGDRTTREGVLLDGAPSGELLGAMDEISHRAATSGNLRLAVHVLLVMESLASDVKDSHRATHAISAALENVNLALSQSTHPSQSSSRSELIVISRDLAKRVSHARHKFPAQEVENFQHLYTIVEFLELASHNEVDKAIRLFYRLPFVPQYQPHVEAKADEFNTVVGDAVVSAMQHTVVVAMGLLVKLYAKESNSAERSSIQQNALALARWLGRWRIHVGKQIQGQMMELEQQLNLK